MTSQCPKEKGAIPGRNGLLFPPDLPPQRGLPKSARCSGSARKPSGEGLSRKQTHQQTCHDSCSMGLGHCHPPETAAAARFHSASAQSVTLDGELGEMPRPEPLARQGSRGTGQGWAEGASSPTHLRTDLLRRCCFPWGRLNPASPSVPSLHQHPPQEVILEKVGPVASSPPPLFKPNSKPSVF